MPDWDQLYFKIMRKLKEMILISGIKNKNNKQKTTIRVKNKKTLKNNLKIKLMKNHKPIKGTEEKIKILNIHQMSNIEIRILRIQKKRKISRQMMIKQKIEIRLTTSMKKMIGYTDKAPQIQISNIKRNLMITLLNLSCYLILKNN